MTRYSAQERQAIANGEFFTKAELAAKPGLGRNIVSTAAKSETRRDPNNAPTSAEARKLAESKGVCAWCHEAGDERSQLVEVKHGAYAEYMHSECDAAWHDEH